VESAFFARDALHDKARVFINQNAQSFRSLIFVDRTASGHASPTHRVALDRLCQPVIQLTRADFFIACLLKKKGQYSKARDMLYSVSRA
jgi:hypothetical protein